MIKKITDLLFTETGKDTTIVAVGTLINAAAGGLFFILVPRMLGPASYGLFATTVAVSIFTVNLANLGIDTGILKFFQSGKASPNSILTVAIKTYVLIGIIIGLIGVLSSSNLASFLNQPALAPLFKIAFASTLLLLLTNFYAAALQAQKKFFQASLVLVVSNVARILVLLVSALLFIINISLVTALFFLVNVLSIVTGRLFLSFKFERADNTIVKQFFGFNFWVWLSLVITSIPYDNFLLLKLSGPAQTGLYFAPFKILTIAYQLGGNFSRVLAPRFSSFNTHQKVKEFTKKTLPIVGIFVLTMLALIPFARIITLIIFGEGYANSIIIFQLLSLGFAFFFASLIPSAIILYYLGDSKASFYITFLKVIIFLTFLFLLIPRTAGAGAALSYMISELTFLIASSVFVLYKLKNGRVS